MNLLNLIDTERPAPGKHDAVFVDAYNTTITDKRGKASPRLHLVVQLAARNSISERFAVERSYTLDARGKNALREDLKKFFPAADAKFLKGFDPESLIGKTAVVLVSTKQDAGQTVAVFTEFSPAALDLKVEGYVRKATQPST